MKQLLSLSILIFLSFNSSAQINIVGDAGIMYASPPGFNNTDANQVIFRPHIGCNFYFPREGHARFKLGTLLGLYKIQYSTGTPYDPNNPYPTSHYAKHNNIYFPLMLSTMFDYRVNRFLFSIGPELEVIVIGKYTYQGNVWIGQSDSYIIEGDSWETFISRGQGRLLGRFDVKFEINERYQIGTTFRGGNNFIGASLNLEFKINGSRK